MAENSAEQSIQAPAKRARMIDIARLAGVSRPAVSAVLSGTGKGNIIVSEKTAAKIRRIAKQLNFHPNHAARQLAGKRSRIIGALAKTWFWQTEQRALAWLNQLAASRNFKILAWQMDAHSEGIDSFVDECLGWNIDGLICVTFKYDEVWPEAVSSMSRLPRIVSILGDPGVPGGHSVEVDVACGVRKCVEHLHRRGRRRIVQILEGTTSRMDRQRYEAFLAAHQEFYGPADDDQVCIATEGWGIEDYAKYEELARHLVVDRRADAILGESDFSAPGLVRGLTKLGKRIPEDVALIGWGYENVGRGVNPGLTTVDFDFEKLVGQALDLVTSLIERPDEQQPKIVLIEPKLRVFESA
jgi:DNA-binding LacI/PurR family transcriptional regulator